MVSTSIFDIVNVRVTFRKAKVPLLEAIAFRGKGEWLKEIWLLDSIKEAVLLQTCNRVELYFVAEQGKNAAQRVKEYLVNRAGVMRNEALKAIEISMNREALRHLLMVASGLDSMVIGENEILGQVWQAFLEAEAAGAAGPILKTVFKKALKVGKLVRKETDISRGAVSLGSVAVKLADSLVGGINGKNVLVIGAGKMGTVVANALARYEPKIIFVANRTYDRALKLAEKVSGRALRFDMLDKALKNADVAICATSAPHYILTRKRVAKVLAELPKDKELIIIDISNPRNVEREVGSLKGVKLYCIDDLQPIVRQNAEKRRRSVEKAMVILEKELSALCMELKTQMVRDCISRLMQKVEKARKEEVAKALNMLGTVSDKERQVIEDLTRILVKKLFLPLVGNLRKAALNGEKKVIEAALKLLEIEDTHLLQWSGEDERMS